MNRLTDLAALEGGAPSGAQRGLSIWNRRRAMLLVWQAGGLALGALLVLLSRAALPQTAAWGIFLETLGWAWIAALGSVVLLDSFVARQPYLHFTVALVSIGVAFSLLFVAFIGTHATYSRWAIVIGLAFTITVQICAWQQWRRRTTLRLGAFDDTLLERVTPTSRFPSNASSFERCDWIVVSDEVRHGSVDGLVLPDDLSAPVRQSAALRAKLAGVNVYSESFVRALLTGRLDLDSAETIFLDDVPTSFAYAAVKRSLDLLGVLTLALFALPITMASMVLIRLESPGSPLILQPRIGLRGKLFRMCKLRTMRELAPGTSDSTEDPQARVTRLGRWLRRSRFDELPQLWNVFLGEMSLIGPRPEWTETAAALERQIPQYAFRYLVRPGITGWAQVHQGHVTAELASRTKLEYDLYYAKNMSLALDLAIGAMTIRTVLTGAGAK